jgi:RimJ/RimL family protein N-acetyltransferase
MTWTRGGETLRAIEPTAAEVRAHGAALVAAYNDPHNARLLGHTAPLDEADVIAHYAALADDGHGFLFLAGDALVADGDLRGVADGAAEMAFLVAQVAQQNRGLGTRVATMLHAFAFARLGLARLYASVRPDNPASRRVFEKLGHAPDPAARRYADEPDDLVLGVDREAFLRSHAAALAEIQITMRPSPA